MPHSRVTVGEIPLNIGASVKLEVYHNNLYKIVNKKNGYIWFEACKEPSYDGGDVDSLINFTHPHRCRLNEEWFRKMLHTKISRKIELEKIVDEIEDLSK